MAFSYEDATTKRQVFDAAATDIVYSNPAGAKVALVVNGVLQQAPVKSQVTALTNITSAAPTDLPGVIADIALIKTKINAIHAALKA